MHEPVSFVQEIVDQYRVTVHQGGDITITMHIPAQFKMLAMVKLSQMTVSDEELAECVSANRTPIQE